jgi:AraC-like DNA-binding protein/mannose-6-phosphate isomerase-like protein (cupin superfamily)
MDVKEYFQDIWEFEQNLEHLYENGQVTDDKLMQEYRKSRYFKRIHQNFNINCNDGTEYINNNENVYELDVDFFVNAAIRNPYNLKYIYNYHRHNYIEVIYVYEGTYKQFINGKKHTLNEGDICILNPNCIHRELNIAEGDFVIFLCISKHFLDIDMLRDCINKRELIDFFNIESYSKNAPKEYILFKSMGDSEIKAIIEMIIKENYYKKTGYQYIIKGYIVRLFAMLFNNYEEIYVSEDIEKVENSIFYEIDSYIRENVSTVSRSELGDIFFFDPDHINRIIRKNTGKTYSQYLIDIKMEMAGEMIIDSKESINNIIKKLGYSNKSYFYKKFTDKYGVTPNEYRKNIKNYYL